MTTTTVAAAGRVTSDVPLRELHIDFPDIPNRSVYVSHNPASGTATGLFLLCRVTGVTLLYRRAELDRATVHTTNGEGTTTETYDTRNWPCLPDWLRELADDHRPQDPNDPIVAVWDRGVIHPQNPDDPDGTLITCLTRDRKRPVALFVDRDQTEALGQMLTDPPAPGELV